jgi:hypothetical protein
MAPGTGFRQAQRVHRRERVSDLANIVNTVTVHTIGDGVISTRQLLAVNTGSILRELIHTLLGLELVDQVGITVAPGAKLRDSRSFDLAQESAGPTHCQFGIILIAIPAMAIRTTESPVLMYICREGEDWCLQIALHRTMALNARVPGFQHTYRQ